MIRRNLSNFFLAAGSLATVACLNDTPLAPAPGAVRLSLAASIHDQAGQTDEYRVAIRVFYLRENQQAVTLPSSPAEVRVPAGTTTSRDISVQSGSCLADTFRTGGEEGGCLLIIELRLLDESGGVISSHAQELFVDAGSGVVTPPPFVLTGPQRMLVIEDSNMFDNRAMNSAGNLQFARNLVNFFSPLPRGAATVLQLDCGRPGLGVADNSDYCNLDMSTFRTTVTNAGYLVRQTSSSSGSLTVIPADVKVLMLVTPCQDFTAAEVNAIRQFVAQGGRAILVGEWTDFLGDCRAVENQLLQNLGSSLVSVDGALECDGQVASITATAIRSHQITTQVNALTSFCSAELLPGAGDDGIIYDRTNTRVLAALTTVSTTALPNSSSSVALAASNRDASPPAKAGNSSRSGPPAPQTRSP
jgi:hypothetical protein